MAGRETSEKEIGDNILYFFFFFTKADTLKRPSDLVHMYCVLQEEHSQFVYVEKLTRSLWRLPVHQFTLEGAKSNETLSTAIYYGLFCLRSN